jgi:hypothetical protein
MRGWTCNAAPTALIEAPPERCAALRKESFRLPARTLEIAAKIRSENGRKERIPSASSPGIQSGEG